MDPIKRPSWDEYFMEIAQATARRANCSRRAVGAVLVKENRILSTGYNGAPAGRPGCLDGACPRGALSYEQQPEFAAYDDPTSPSFCTAVHAEANAVIYAGRDAVGATAYITARPCPGCLKLLMAAGVWFAVWPEYSMNLTTPNVWDNYRAFAVRAAVSATPSTPA